MNILIKKLRKNCSKIAAMAVISAVVVVIILVSRVMPEEYAAPL